MAIKITLLLANRDSHKSIVQNVFDCPLSGVINECFFTVIEIVLSFLHKH